jgi:hypothetical protein
VSKFHTLTVEPLTEINPNIDDNRHVGQLLSGGQTHANYFGDIRVWDDFCCNGCAAYGSDMVGTGNWRFLTKARLESAEKTEALDQSPGEREHCYRESDEGDCFSGTE